MTDDRNERVKRSKQLGALRAQLAELPREIAPARELWPDVRAAIDAAADNRAIETAADNPPPVAADAPPPPVAADDPSPVAAEDPPAVVRKLPRALRFSGSYPWIAAAAAALLVVGASLWFAMVDGAAHDASDGRPVADRYARLEEPYVAAAAELSATLERRRDELPRDVVTPYTSALAVIDEALRETRAAVAADPDNEALAEMALAAHRRKLDFLQRVALWSTDE